MVGRIDKGSLHVLFKPGESPGLIAQLFQGSLQEQQESGESPDSIYKACEEITSNESQGSSQMPILNFERDH